MTDLSKLVKPLVWTEVEVDRGDGSTDLTGGLEADSPFGAFVIDLGWGSDCYYWSIQSPEGDDLGSNFEDALYAKAAAQADYTARIFAALDPEALARWRDEAVQAEREACAKLRYFHPEGETMAQMRDHARNHPIYREGDLKLVWVNEGDLCNLAIRAMKGCTP